MAQIDPHTLEIQQIAEMSSGEVDRPRLAILAASSRRREPIRVNNEI